MKRILIPTDFSENAFNALEYAYALAGNNAAYVLMSSYCLLYTSPSPRDRTRSRMPSSA